MPSYQAKPYVVPLDDWFNNNSSDYENQSKARKTKNLTTVHEFFYRQSHLKVGGSENLLQTTLEKKSSSKIIISSHQNSDKGVSSRYNGKYSYSIIPTDIKSIKKRSSQSKTIYKNLSNKNIFIFKSYLLGLKSVFTKVIRRKISKINNFPL